LSILILIGILQEHAVNRILRDLVQLLEPISMVVEADCKVRGGLRSRAIAKYDKEHTGQTTFSTQERSK